MKFIPLAVSSLILVTVFVPGVLSPRAHAQALIGPGQAPKGGPNFAPGQVLVQFKSRAKDADLADAVGRAGLGIREYVSTGPMKAAGHPGIAVASTRLPVLE